MESSRPPPARSRPLVASSLSRLAFNLVPVWGCIFLSWDAGTLLVLYWAENFVIGLVSVLWLLSLKGGSVIERLALILIVGPVFLVAYGFLWTFHGFFVFGYATGDLTTELPGLGWPFPLFFLEMPIVLVRAVAERFGDQIAWPLVFLGVGQMASYLFEAMAGRSVEDEIWSNIFVEPFQRVFVVHLALFVAFFPVQLMGSPLPLLIVMILGKTGLDVGLHLRARRRKASPTQTTSATERERSSVSA